MKSKSQLNQLLFRLTNQQLSFFFEILELLRSANVEEVVERSDITEIECLLVLQSAKTGAYLQEYLGQHYDAFVETLGRYETCLKIIARKLKHIRRLPQIRLNPFLLLQACYWARR